VRAQFNLPGKHTHFGFYKHKIERDTVIIYTHDHAAVIRG